MENLVVCLVSNLYSCPLPLATNPSPPISLTIVTMADNGPEPALEVYKIYLEQNVDSAKVFVHFMCPIVVIIIIIIQFTSPVVVTAS